MRDRGERVRYVADSGAIRMQNNLPAPPAAPGLLGSASDAGGIFCPNTAKI